MRKKLVILVLAIILIPGIISAVMTSNQVESNFATLLSERTYNQLQVSKNIFEKLIEDNSVKARLISKLGVIQMAVKDKNYSALNDYLTTIHHDMQILHHQGSVEIYDDSQILLGSLPRGRKLTDSSLINSALKNNFATALTLVNDRLKLSSCSPILFPQAKTKKPTAAACVSLFISHKLADEIKSIDNTEIIFIAEEDEVFKVIGSSIFVERQRVVQFDHKRIEHMINGHLEVGQVEYYMNVYRKKLLRGNIYIAVAVNKTRLTNMVFNIQLMLSVIGFFASLGAILFAILFSRKDILKPIKKLHEGAVKIGKGDYSSPVSVKSGDEFEFLGNTLDKMRLEIKQKIEEIESVNDELDREVYKLSLMNKINQAIIKYSSSDLLKQILKLIVEHLQVERSSIMLLDKNSNEMIVKMIHSKDKPESPSSERYISLKVGEGIAGHVAETGEPFISNEPSREPLFKPYAKPELNNRLKNLLCVPLLGEELILGVINIDNKPGGFSPDDLELMKHIADPIAIALQNTELYEQSITDGMTQLFIHRYFQAMLETEIKRAERYKLTFTLMMFDIDHFKKFNDTYGHQVGDIVIKKVAEILKINVRDGIDIAARYGGEEFAVIMPGTDLEGAYQVAERLRQHIDQTYIEHAAEELHVTISLGCAEYPTHAETKDALIDAADRCLYRSKEKGRNATTTFNELQDENPLSDN